MFGGEVIIHAHDTTDKENWQTAVAYFISSSLD